MPENGDQNIGLVEGMAGDFRQRDDPISKGARRLGGGIDVQSQPDQIRLVSALAQQPGQLSPAIEQIVGPFQQNVVGADELGGSVPYRQAGDERNLMRRKVLVDGQDKRDGEAAGAGPPGIGIPSASGELVAGQHNRRREQLAAPPQQSGLVVGAAQARGPVQTKWSDLLPQAFEVESGDVPHAALP